MMRIGFVGLGNMGAPMCHRLIQAGHQVHAFDADADRTAAAVAAGARAAASAADAGALAALSPGTVWVDLTTNQIDLVTSLADRAPDGVAVVDSPVTGAVDGARNGRLTLFAGGDAGVIDRVRPALDVLGTVIDCGPLGTGNVVKLVTNQLWFVAAAALGEGFALGVRHGVDLRVLWSAIRQSVGDSFVAAHDDAGLSFRLDGDWTPPWEQTDPQPRHLPGT